MSFSAPDILSREYANCKANGEALSRIYDMKIYLGRLRCHQKQDTLNFNRFYELIEDSPFDDIDIPIYDIDTSFFSDQSNLAAVADEEGAISIVDTHMLPDAGSILRQIKGHCNATFSVCWSPHEKNTILSAGGDRLVKIWDVSSRILSTHSFFKHTKTVRKARFSPESSSLIVSCGRDSKIYVWDRRVGESLGFEPVNSILGAHALNPKQLASNPSNAAADVLFLDQTTLISCGASDGLIKFWDLRKSYKCLKKNLPVSVIPYPILGKSMKGYSSLSLDRSRRSLFACSVQNKIFQFSVSGEEKPIANFKSPETLGNFCRIDLSSDGKFLSCGGMTSHTHIWKVYGIESHVDPFARLVYDSPHFTSVVSFNKIKGDEILTGNDDRKLKLWRFKGFKGKMNHNEGDDDLEDVAELRFPEDHGARFLPSTVHPGPNLNSFFPSKAGGENRDPNSKSYPCSRDISFLLKNLPNTVVDADANPTLKKCSHLNRKFPNASKKRRNWLSDYSNVLDSTHDSVNTPTKKPKLSKTLLNVKSPSILTHFKAE